VGVGGAGGNAVNNMIRAKLSGAVSWHSNRLKSVADLRQLTLGASQCLYCVGAEVGSGVDFVTANTDAQALHFSLTPKRLQLGRTTTRGLGAGANPEIGMKPASG